MRKSLVILLVVAAAAATFLYLRQGYVYEISEADIQNRIDGQFPVQKCVLVFCIELKKPFVHFADQDTRIEFGSAARMEIAFSKDKYDGEAGFSGELKYVSDKGAFFLDDSRLEYLKVSGVSEENKKNLDHLAAAMVKDYLSANPIYSFKNTALALIAPWLELKDVSVREGILRLRIGLAA